MKIVVIVNARAKLARNEPALETIRKKFGGFLHSIATTASAQDAIDMTRRAARDKVDTIVVVGGDGTVNGVLDALAGTGIALGIIPNGTANDLSSLHELPVRLSAACDVILQRQVHAVDLISTNGRHFVTGGGLGLPSVVAARANEIKSRRGLAKMARVVLGGKLYLASAVPALLGKVRPGVRLTIQSDQGSLQMDSLALMINNQPFVGRHFYSAPEAANDDGQFDVCLVENPRRRIELAATLLQVLHGSHLNLPSVTNWRARELHVRASAPLPFFADGEHLGTQTQFALRIVPRSLNLIIPGDQTRVSMRAIRKTNNPGNCFAERLAAAFTAHARIPDVERPPNGASVRSDDFHEHARTMGGP
jgi:diacylglycerol kinase (ATP)